MTHYALIVKYLVCVWFYLKLYTTKLSNITSASVWYSIGIDGKIVGTDDRNPKRYASNRYAIIKQIKIKVIIYNDRNPTCINEILIGDTLSTWTLVENSQNCKSTIYSPLYRLHISDMHKFNFINFITLHLNPIPEFHTSSN